MKIKTKSELIGDEKITKLSMRISYKSWKK